MSIRLMSRVWDAVPLKGTELLLLLTIADHANEQGICWPRQERLAMRVRCSVRQTRRLLRELEAGGYITVCDGRGRGKMATIQINLDLLADGQKAVADVPFSEEEKGTSSVAHERTSSAPMQEESEAEKGTSSALEKGTSSVAHDRTFRAAMQEKSEAENGTSSALEKGTSSVANERTSSAQVQEESEAKNGTSSALEKGTYSVANERTSSAQGQEESEAENGTSSALEKGTSSVAHDRTFSAAMQGESEAEKGTSSALEKGTSEVTQGLHQSPERVRQSVESGHASLQKRTSGAEKRSPVTDKRTSSAPKPDIAPHACVEPSKIHQEIHQEKHKSVFSASLTSLDAPLEESMPASDYLTVEAAVEARNAPPATVAAALASLAAASDFDVDDLPVAHDIFGAVVNVVAKVARGPSEEDTPQQRYFSILAWIVGADYTTISKEMKGQVAQTVGILQRAGYTEDDLRTFWHTVWKKDWRWTKNHAHPTLTQVRAEIGKLRVGQQAEALALRRETGRDANGKPILTPEEQEMQRLMREAKERGRLKREAAQNQGVRLPDLQGHEVGHP